MKLRNSTSWQDWFLRRVVSWCCKELEMKQRIVRSCVFRNSRSSWGGCAYLSRYQISVCIGRDSDFPESRKSMRGTPERTLNDRLECLVWVTAHELAHLLQYSERSGTRQGGNQGGSEQATEWFASKALTSFRAMRDTLLSTWNNEPALRIAAPVDRYQVKLAKAQKDFARWTRKLKLAQGKVKKYQRQLKRLTAVPQPNPPRIGTETIAR